MVHLLLKRPFQIFYWLLSEIHGIIKSAEVELLKFEGLQSKKITANTVLLSIHQKAENSTAVLSHSFLRGSPDVDGGQKEMVD